MDMCTADASLVSMIRSLYTINQNLGIYFGNYQLSGVLMRYMSDIDTGNVDRTVVLYLFPQVRFPFSRLVHPEQI